MDKAFKEKEKIMQTGFIAQEVEKSAKEIGYDFSGVDAAKNENDIYGLRYADFVVPLVKAVQELSAKNDEKDKLINDLQSEINELKSLILKGGSGTTFTSSAGYLKQNVPNPADNNTLISYYVPENANKAEIRITDLKGGTLKIYNATAGQGYLNIKSGELPAGTYNYTLYVNDKNVTTKQMVIIK